MLKKSVNVKSLFWLLMIGQIVLAVITLNDVATAQGVGLYCAMLKGSTERLPFDILVTACGTVTLLVVLLMPFWLVGHRSAESMLRFVIAYFGFMPALSLAMLIHLFDGHNLLQVSFDFESNMSYLSNFPREVIPLLVLLFVGYRKAGFTVKKWQKILLTIVLILCVGMLFLPELALVLLHTMFYLLVVVAFDWWEELYPISKTWYEKMIWWMIFGLLMAKGVHQMLFLLASYHL